MHPQRLPFSSPENAGQDARLDRIERTLERLIADHQQFRQFHNQLLNAQLLHHESIKRFLKIAQQHTLETEEQAKQIEQQGLQIEALGVQSRQRSDGIDLRIERIISAVGEFIRKTPSTGS